MNNPTVGRTTCDGGGGAGVAVVSSKLTTDLFCNNHGDNKEGMADSPMREYAFHHDMFNSYVDREGDAMHVLRQPFRKNLSMRLCFVLRWGATGNTGRRVCEHERPTQLASLSNVF